MQLKNQYYFFKSIIPPETCQKIIDLGLKTIEFEKAQGRSTRAYTGGDRQKDAMPNAVPQGELSASELKDHGIETPTYVRDSDVAWLGDQWLYDLIYPLVDEANMKAGWQWQWDSAEKFQFTVYKPSGFYSWHKDGPSDQFGVYRRYIEGITQTPRRANGLLPDQYTDLEYMVGKVRKLSVTLNLNEPGAYDGGNLKFDYGKHIEGENQFHECEEIRPQGSVIVFPSFADHCVTPVTQGTRYSLVLWCLGNPFK
jgi:PKHD-type hydroxylase